MLKRYFLKEAILNKTVITRISVTPHSVILKTNEVQIKKMKLMEGMIRERGRKN